jgi:hypothetical protein
MKHILISILLASVCLAADTYDRRFVDTAGRIYTAADSSNPGGITGALQKGDITYAMAIDHDRKRVYRGEIKGSSFSFKGIAVGKYDLVLITSDNKVYEGLALGEPTKNLSPALLQNLQVRVAKADEFYNRSTVHRVGVVEDRAFAFIERIRDRRMVKQNADVMDAEMRRLEVTELIQATDNWQMTDTRHIYREAEPGAGRHRPFLEPKNIPALGNIRVVDTVKQLGTITLPHN